MALFMSGRGGDSRDRRRRPGRIETGNLSCSVLETNPHKAYDPSPTTAHPGTTSDARHLVDWITEDLLIGNHLDAGDVSGLQERGIRSILSLDGSLAGADYSPHGVEEIVVVELIDGSGNRPEVFMRAVKTLARLRADRPPVLVHCHAGRSRSAVVVASHFMRDQGLSLAEAMNAISERREVMIAPGLQEALDFHTNTTAGRIAIE